MKRKTFCWLDFSQFWNDHKPNHCMPHPSEDFISIFPVVIYSYGSLKRCNQWFNSLALKRASNINILCCVYQENERSTGDNTTVSDGQNMLGRLEEIHDNLKGVTGISDSTETERLFVQLDNSTKNLRRLIKEREMRPELLRSQNARLQRLYQDVRNIGNAKMRE